MALFLNEDFQNFDIGEVSPLIQSQSNKNNEFQPKMVKNVSYSGTLKSQCHPKCFASRGTFFIYEKSAIFLIDVKSDLYLHLHLHLLS